MHISELVVAALKLEGELFVVDAKKVEDGGVQVVDAHRVRIRFSKTETFFEICRDSSFLPWE